MATNFMVRINPGESVEKAIRLFCRLFIKSGTKSICIANLQYTSPSERRARHNERIRRAKKHQKP